MNVVLTLLKREISWLRFDSGQQEECAMGGVDNRRTEGGVEDSGRSWGQREELRTVGGVEDSGRSWGQREELRTGGGVEDSGRSWGQQEVEDNVRSWGQGEELRTAGGAEEVTASLSVCFSRCKIKVLWLFNLAAAPLTNRVNVHSTMVGRGVAILRR